MAALLIALVLLVLGGFILTQGGKTLGPILIAAAIAVLAIKVASATELPVRESILPPGARSISVTLTKEQSRADRESDRKRKMPQKKFERDLLSAPIGKGRLE